MTSWSREQAGSQAWAEHTGGSCGILVAGPPAWNGAPEEHAMTWLTRYRIPTGVLLLAVALLAGGCGQPDVQVEYDWCSERGVPEPLCPHCNPELEEKFKATHDWCEKHKLPRSQCFTCSPQLKAEFEKLKPE